MKICQATVLLGAARKPPRSPYGACALSTDATIDPGVHRRGAICRAGVKIPVA